jgi:hypothetical protein
MTAGESVSLHQFQKQPHGEHIRRITPQSLTKINDEPDADRPTCRVTSAPGSPRLERQHHVSRSIRLDDRVGDHGLTGSTGADRQD